MKKLLGSIALVMLFTMNVNAQEVDPIDDGVVLDPPPSIEDCSEAFWSAYDGMVDDGWDEDFAYSYLMPSFRDCMGWDD